MISEARWLIYSVKRAIRRVVTVVRLLAALEERLERAEVGLNLAKVALLRDQDTRDRVDRLERIVSERLQ